MISCLCGALSCDIMGYSVMSCSVYAFGTVTLVFKATRGHQRSPFSLILTVLVIQEPVHTPAMLNILVGIAKQCVTRKGQVLTPKGHCKVKVQVRNHPDL